MPSEICSPTDRGIDLPEKPIGSIRVSVYNRRDFFQSNHF
jgi:hypothetical protein